MYVCGSIEKLSCLREKALQGEQEKSDFHEAQTSAERLRWQGKSDVTSTNVSDLPVNLDLQVGCGFLSYFNAWYFVKKQWPLAISAHPRSMATNARTAVPYLSLSCMILPYVTRVLGGLGRPIL